MPLYTFTCPNCNKDKRKLLSSEAAAKVACVICDCGDFMKRVYTAPSARVTETLDNGIMVKKVERLQNAEEVYYDRGHTPQTRE